MEDVIEEELMALESIFYDSYSKLSDNRFRIRIDPDVEDEGGGDLPPALFLEVLLPEGYPQTLPQFDLSNINNSKYPESVKSAIVEGLLQQAGQQRGESMCYNLVEWLKEQLLSFYALKPPPTPQVDSDDEDLGHSDTRPGSGAMKKDTNAKDKLTKAQKRRHFDKYGAGSEKPRGWDWVPILSHVQYFTIQSWLLSFMPPRSGPVKLLSYCPEPMH